MALAMGNGATHMRAIRINPYDRTVTEVETTGAGPGHRGLYELLSAPTHKVDIFTTVSLGGRDGETIYLDDDGFLQPGHAVWRLQDYGSPLAGVGVIVGTDDGGDSISTALSVQDVQALVSWTDDESSGELSEGRDATPAEARAMSHGLADFGWIGGGPILQPRGTFKIS